MKLAKPVSLRALIFSLVLFGVVVSDGTHLIPTPREAQAQFIADKPFRGTRRNIELNLRFSSYYGYGWYRDDFCNGYCGYYGSYGVGPGFQLLFPILQNGPIPSINNALYLGVFTDFMFHGDYYGDYDLRYGFFSLPIGVLVQWRFYLFEILSVYANLGAGFWPWFFRDDHFYYRGGGVLLRGFPLFELGLNLHFTKNIGMNFEFGYPAARIGLNIGF
ncbi:MAG: hypothetical protein U1A78_15565 [Polyangia bacterium]